MSDQAATPSRDEDATSMTSSQVNQSCWMSRWINGSSKHGPAVDNSSLIFYKGEHVDSRLMMEDGLPYGKRVCNSDEKIQDLTTKPGDFGKKLGKFPFRTLSLGKNKENASTIGTRGDNNVLGHKPISLALAVCKGGPSRDFNSRGSDQQDMSQLCQESKVITTSRPCAYNKSDGSKPVVVFERHFSNDNFTSFSQEDCKYQKSSSVLFHEKMQNDHCHVSGSSNGIQHGSLGKKNFQSYFLKKQSQNDPCSFQNVETMRICTMVDSVENSPGDAPKISQRAHHIVFTKETCINMSKGHQVNGKPSLAHQDENTSGGSFSMSLGDASRSRGVKIQPLWTSTDSEEKETTGNLSICKASSRNEASAETDGLQVELSLAHQKEKKLGGSFRLYSNGASHYRGGKIQPFWASTDSENRENTGNPSTCKAESRNEASAETDGMRAEVPTNQHILLGMESSSLTKYDAVDDNSPPTACDSSTEKARSKWPINEELPGLQPAVSSTIANEPSTSRVHSLNAKQLFSCNEQTSRPECKVCIERSVGQDAGSRWIKRLKLNSSDSFGVSTRSSDVGEGLSHDKFSPFFNRITKGKRESYHGKEQMVIDQNVESLKKRNRSMMHGCSWMQRWCQNCTGSKPSNPEPLVICEPHSMKFVQQEELAKKQFPSIAAMALMGKAMNGFPSCKFKKRGPVVVWNTKEY